MAKYKCVLWNDEHRQYIKDHFTTQTNDEIGEYLQRTPDAVRKELNNLKLRRPKKSILRKMDRLGVDNFFKHFAKGQIKKEQNKKVQQLQEKRNQRNAGERAWSERAFGGANSTSVKPQSSVGKSGPVTKGQAVEKVWITIGDKRGTRMEVPKGTEELWKKKFLDKENEIYNKLNG